MQRTHKFLRQDNVFHIKCMVKKWCYLLVLESCYTAANTGHKELVFSMLFGKLNEIIHVWLDGFHPTLHGGYAITLTLQSHALAPYRAKAIVGQPCCATAMCTSKVTAEHKYLIRLQFRYSFGGIISLVHNSIRLVINK